MQPSRPSTADSDFDASAPSLPRLQCCFKRGAQARKIRQSTHIINIDCGGKGWVKGAPMRRPPGHQHIVSRCVGANMAPSSTSRPGSNIDFGTGKGEGESPGCIRPVKVEGQKSEVKLRPVRLLYTTHNKSFLQQGLHKYFCSKPLCVLKTCIASSTF